MSITINIYYLALSYLQSYCLFEIYYKSGGFRDRKNVINKLRVPLFDYNTEQAS